MKSKIHILVLTPFLSPNVGGVETHLDDLIEYLTRNGFYNHIITYQPLTTQYRRVPFLECTTNIRIYRLPWLKFNLFYRLENIPSLQFLYLFPGIFVFAFLYMTAYSSKITSIHGHGLAAAFATLILSKIFGKRSVVSLHTIYKFKERSILAAIVKRVLFRIDNVLVLARECKEDLVKIGIREKKVIAYTCWVDNRNRFVQMNQKESRRKVNLPEDKFIVLFVGRLSHEKGVNVVLDLVKLMEHKEILFVVVGNGPMRAEVNSVASRNRNLIARDSVPNEDLRLHYNAADILLLGSVDMDYFGRTTMEALSCGLPVILPKETSYFGKRSEVTVDFPDGEIGYMVSLDPESLKERIEFAFYNPQVIEMQRVKSREFALRSFSVKNAEIFRHVLGREDFSG